MAKSKSTRTVVPRFKVGDIAELVYVRTSDPGPFPGAEVEVVGGLETRGDIEGIAGTERGYEIQIGCSPRYCVLPEQLRPISPRDPLQTALWSECPWQPGKPARVRRRKQRARLTFGS